MVDSNTLKIYIMNPKQPLKSYADKLTKEINEIIKNKLVKINRKSGKR